MTIKLPFESFDEFCPKQEKSNGNADYGFLVTTQVGMPYSYYDETIAA